MRRLFLLAVSVLGPFLFFLALTIPAQGIAAENFPPQLQPLEDLFATPTDEIDLVHAKYVIDRIIDPAISAEAGATWFDTSLIAIEKMAGPDTSDEQKMAALGAFLYQPGPWNGNHPFSYDHEDPLGENISNKLMANYLTSRRGNCVTMPFLVILLADRMGLDVTASTAPLHVFVKFTPKGGQTLNLEATSGAHPARDVWYRQNLPMTDLAVRNGVYMKKLSREETLAVMGAVVVEHYLDTGQYALAARAADILIAHYQNYAYLHVIRGSALYGLIDGGFYKKYLGPADIPERERPYLEFLLRENQKSFQTAEQLGWVPEEGGLRGPLPEVEK